MKQVASWTPFLLCASLLPLVLCGPVFAVSQPGDYSFALGIGQSNTTKDTTYGSDQTINFALIYQKSHSAAYRAMAGFLTLSGKEEISPTVGTRAADAFFMTGDIVFTPRFRVLNPFLGAGLGFYDVRITDSKSTSNGLELGVNWGFGMDVQILRWFAIHGDVSYHYLTGGDIPNPVQTIVVGGRFDF